MVFQPVYDLEHGDVFAYEALARFPVEPYRPPRTGSRTLPRSASGSSSSSRRSTARSQGGEAARGVRLAVNVSPLTALSPQFFNILAPRAKRVIIEVTEHERVEDYDALNEALAPSGSSVPGSPSTTSGRASRA